jgi:hypothetical protein
MVRHADGGFTWERSADVARAARYDATFTDVEDAADFYDDHACQFCWTHKRMHDDRCCDVQTWTRS